jgi:calcineurin-like phosphoesterase family protein
MKYFIGDVHGCIKTLKELVQQICIIDKNPKLYFVGDLIDRGPDSKAVIDYIIDLNISGVESMSVRGNHEEMLINAYLHNQRITDTDWCLNGASNTIKSFNVNADLNKRVKDLIPEAYFQYIITLPYFIELPDYIIVHAGLNFRISNPLTDFKTMIWTREEQYNKVLAKGKRIIHGHSPIPLEKLKCKLELGLPDVINIDTGCVYIQHKELGNLTAINAETLDLISVKNMDLI